METSRTLNIEQRTLNFNLRSTNQKLTRRNTMKKQITGVLAATAALMAIAGAASAASYAIPSGSVEMNIYGASAQFGFWNAAARDMVMETVANGGFGCADHLAGIDSTGKTFGITVGRNCAGVAANKDIVIRYSSKASYDGIYAVKGTLDTDSCGNAKQRKLADETVLDAAAPMASTTATATAITAVKCVPVTLGASDVAGDTFTQNSAGQTSWSNTAPYLINGASPAFNGISTSGLLDHKTLVVPFAFYVNSKVTVGTCTAGSANVGGQCVTAADCGTAGTCTVATLDNMSRLMAVQIFSGTAAAWTDFGAGFAAKDVVACLRHAGSGTHATLDKSIMYGINWGSTTQASQILPASATAGAGSVFNVDTSTELGCVANYDGGVGYADADASQAGTTKLKYNGVAAKRTNVRNGLYDTFYSFQHLYENDADTTTAQDTARNMMLKYVSVHALPKAEYWATAGEMMWGKTTDAGYPGYIGDALNCGVSGTASCIKTP
jgi:hypothetical protein